MKKLSAHPALAHARTENEKLIRQWDSVFTQTNRPNPRFTKKANNSKSAGKDKGLLQWDSFTP